MWHKATIAVLVLAASAAVAQAGDLDKARKLADIGDYAAAVVQLGELASADPANAQVRLLLATCFAKCEYELQLSGPVSLGRANTDRAMYQLGILAGLGKDGTDALIGAIGDKDDRLALPAIRTAGKVKLAAAVDALIAELDRPEPPPKPATGAGAPFRPGFPAADPTVAPRQMPRRMAAAVEALAQIGGNRGAAAILKRVATQPEEQRDVWLLTQYAACAEGPQAAATIRSLIANSKARGVLIALYLRVSDEAALVKAAQTEQDKDILAAMCNNTQSPQAALEALARRTELPDRDRTAAINGLSYARASGSKYDPKSMTVCLSELTNDPSGEVRWTAIDRLAYLDPEKAVPGLLVALGDRTHAGQALSKLSEMKSPAAIAPLMTVLEEMTDANELVKYKVNPDSVFAALMACGVQGETLYKAVKLKMTGPTGASQFSRNMPDLPRDVLPGIIDKLLGESDVNLRRMAMARVGSLDPKDRLTEVCKVLTDKDLEVRRQAGEQLLVLVNNNEAKPSQVAVLMESDVPELAQRAAELLARVGDASVTDAFLKLLKDRQRGYNVFRYAGAFFARHPDARAVGPLIEAVLDVRCDSEGWGLDNIAKAIKGGATDLPAAAKAVAKGLESQHPEVRTSAAKALRLFGDKSVLPQLQDAAGRAQVGTSERVAIDAAIRELGGEVKKP